MKAYLLFTSNRPLVILTSYGSVEHPELLKKLESEGITKFIAYEVSIESTRSNYGMHFDFACNDMKGSNDIKMLAYGDRSAPGRFSFNELSNPIFHEPEQISTLVGAGN